MWFFRRTLNVSWVDKANNVEVLRRMGKDPEVINRVKPKEGYNI